MISVIIPTFNRGDCILGSVNSVLSQTYQDLELIVVDDCSTDNTEQVFKDFKDPRVRYHKLDRNGGAPRARNIGVQMSRGEYVAFQDSDDIWLEDKLEKQMHFLLETKADVVACNFDYVSEHGKHPLIDDAHKKNIEVKTADLLPHNFVSTQTIFGRKEVFANIPFREKMPRLQDWLLALEITRTYRMCFDHRSLVEVDAIRADRISGVPENLRIGMENIFEWVISEYMVDPQNMKEAVEKLKKEYAHQFLVSNVFVPKEMNELRKENLSLRMERDKLEESCLAINQEREEMLNSKSWRITEPLRALMRAVKQ